MTNPAPSPLPVPPTSFVGREQELAELEALLADPGKRLITVLGPGGSGKTRLAIEAARRAARGPGEVAFADLDAVQDAAGLPLGIADALGVRLASQEPPAVQLERALADHRLLLVLDNFEHLVEGAGLLSGLLREAPGIRILATSRVALSLEEEWVFPLPGLPLPDAETPATRSPAVTLFVERALRGNVRVPAGEELEAIVAICRAVEGSPLAIELAASWTRSLTIAEIADEVTRGFASLESALRNVPERHRSVRAVFERSWSLLAPAEQAILVRLAAFEGGFSRDGAAAVAGATLPQLASLVDRSLVQPRGGGRYGLHEMIRQCALEHASAGELPAEARDAHMEYFARFVADRERGIEGIGQEEAANDLDAELSNIRAATSRALQRRDASAAFRLSDAFGYFLTVRGRHRELYDLMDALLACDWPEGPERPVLLASTCTSRGWARLRFGQVAEAEADFLRAQETYAAAGFEARPGLSERPVAGFAVCALTRGDYAAAAQYASELLALAEGVDDPMGAAMALYVLGNIAYSRGDLAEARRHARDGLARATKYGDAWFAAYLHADLANIALASGDLPETEAQSAAAYRIRERLRDAEGMALALLQLAAVAVARGDIERAERLTREALVLYRQAGDVGGIVRATSALAGVAARHGDREAAVERALRAVELLQEIDATPIQLETLAGVAEVFQGLGDTVGALDLLHFILGRAETSHPTRARAEGLLEQLAAPAPVASESRRRSTALTLEAAIAAARTALGKVAAGSADGGLAVETAEPLTPREREVLEMLARGATNPEVATRLGISEGTVKWYTARLYEKLGVRNRTQAVGAARSRGLID